MSGQLATALLPKRRRAAAAASATRRLVLAACAAAALGATGRAVSSCWAGPAATGRRSLLAAITGGAVVAGTGSDAHAFDNAVKKIKREMNNPKKPGMQPVGLGLNTRPGFADVALKDCAERTPNCFSTTSDVIDSGLHDLRPWKFSGKSVKAAFDDLVSTINEYKPGQNGIDGGGFKILAQDGQCVYTLFESLKRGHIDDVELCIEPGTDPNAQSGNVLVRSGSRQGFFDYGVNAARLNFLSKTVSTKGGWTTEQITSKSHARYWQLNCQGGDGYKAPFSVRTKFPEECKEFPILAEPSLMGKT